MSLLDYAPRTEPDFEVRLHMRLSVQTLLALIALAIICLSGFSLVYFVAVDPDWRPSHVRGKGALFVLLLLVLPVFWRAVVLWMLGGLTAFGVVTRAMRIGDKQVDFVIGQDGITNVGLFYSRMVAWKYIERIEIRKQGYVKMAHFKRMPGTKVEIVETFRGISKLHVFNKGMIVIPLELVGLSPDHLTNIVHRFQPDLAIHR